MKRLKPINILIQVLAVALIASAFSRFYIAYRSESYEVLKYVESKNLHDYKAVESPGLLLTYYFMAWSCGKLLAIIILFIINLKNKLSYWNSIIVLLLGLIPVPFLPKNFTVGIINTYESIFSSVVLTRTLIGGVSLSVLGIALLWWSYRKGKNLKLEFQDIINLSGN